MCSDSKYQTDKSVIGTHTETPAHISGCLADTISAVYPPPDAPTKYIRSGSIFALFLAYSTALKISCITISEPVASGLLLGPRKFGYINTHLFLIHHSA